MRLSEPKRLGAPVDERTFFICAETDLCRDQGMITEMLHSLLVGCPRWGRRLGLAREHVAISARYRRVGRASAPHLTACRTAILEAAQMCARRRCVVIVGAGSCLDVPVAELAQQFEMVVLADVVTSLPARRFARRFPGRVRLVTWDATGALERLVAAKCGTPAEIAACFEEAEPGALPGGAPDLVVSANCLSQLGLVVDTLAPGCTDDERWRGVAAAARRHLAWLDGQPGVRLLLADVARLEVPPEGAEGLREDCLEGLGLREPDRRWRWDIAPIPEYSARVHRVHEVGAWLAGPDAGFCAR